MSKLKSGSVVTATIDRTRFVDIGKTVDDAKTNLRNKLYDTFGEKRLFPDYIFTEIEDVGLAGLFYVKFCYNGERIDDNSLSNITNSDDFDPNEMWGDNWRKKIRDQIE